MSTTMRNLSHVICTVILTSSGTMADADDPTAAQSHAAEGTKLFNVQRYDKAAEQYQAAYVLDPKPDYLYAAAQAHRLAGDCTRAVPSYRAYLRTSPTPAQRAKAEANLERCTQQDALEAAVQFSDLRAPDALPTPPQPADPVPSPQPPVPSTSYLVGHILVGIGVASIGGGAYFYRKGHSAIEAHNRASTYDDFVAGSGGLDRARLQQTLGVSALAAGGALAVGGIVYYVVRARRPSETVVSAQVTSSNTLVTLSRSF